MNLPDVLHKTSAALLGVATLVLAGDLVHAMTKEALVGKAPVRHSKYRHIAAYAWSLCLRVLLLALNCVYNCLRT